MIRLMADNMCVGDVRFLWNLCRSDDLLRDLLDEAGVSLIEFADVGLSATSSDRAIREVCREGDIVLMTIDRKAGDEDSLEATLREEAAGGRFAEAVPVVTFNRLRLDRETTLFAYELVELLTDIDLYRGTGRQWLPKSFP